MGEEHNGKAEAVSDREQEYRERIASIEGAGRVVNEEIVRQWGELADGGRALFRCECGIGACVEGVWLPHGVYEGVRQDPMLFLIRPGHDLPDVEEIVERGDGYAIVRTSEEVRHIAEQTDPRST
jgi:hypothetical protein